MAKYRTQPFRGPLMRISYAYQMFEAQEKKSDDGTVSYQYGCTLIAPKSDVEGLELLLAKVREAVVGEWPQNGLSRFESGLIRTPLLDGAGKSARSAKTGELRAGMGPDVYMIRPNARDKIGENGKPTGEGRPKVFDKLVMPVTDKRACPSGWWGYPVLTAYAWHNVKNGDGVSFGIQMFQIIKEDEILGGDVDLDPNAFFKAAEAGAAGLQQAAAGGKGAAGIFG